METPEIDEELLEGLPQEESDFADELPLDKREEDDGKDGDDNDVAEELRGEK